MDIKCSKNYSKFQTFSMNNSSGKLFLFVFLSSPVLTSYSSKKLFLLFLSSPYMTNYSSKKVFPLFFFFKFNFPWRIIRCERYFRILIFLFIFLVYEFLFQEHWWILLGFWIRWGKQVMVGESIFLKHEETVKNLWAITHAFWWKVNVRNYLQFISEGRETLYILVISSYDFLSTKSLCCYWFCKEKN